MLDRQTDNYIEKDATNYIKGIALIFMFIHHFFTFPDWYIEGISYPYLSSFASLFCSPLKICVPVFAFLTGYFYYFSKNKKIRYSIKKSTDVWLAYIFVFFILLIPAILLGVYDFSIKSFVLELFALKRPTMIFCWYVVFYISTMFILPIYSRICIKAPCFCFLLFLALPSVAAGLLNKIVFGEATGILQIIDNLTWFPSVGIGYLFAKYRWFFEIKNLVNIQNRILSTLISVLFIVFAMTARYFSCPDIVCAPFFIFGIIEIYHNTKHKIIYKPLSIIGKYSLVMWLLHCIFFNQCKEYTQPILYFPKEPILVTLWGLVICLLVAIVIQIPINGIIKIKNRIFKLDSVN